MNSFETIPYIKSVQALDNIEEKWFTDFLSQHDELSNNVVDDLVYMLQHMNDDFENNKEFSESEESNYLDQISELESEVRGEKDRADTAELDVEDYKEQAKRFEGLLIVNNIDY